MKNDIINAQSVVNNDRPAILWQKMGKKWVELPYGTYMVDIALPKDRITVQLFQLGFEFLYIVKRFHKLPFVHTCTAKFEIDVSGRPYYLRCYF